MNIAILGYGGQGKAAYKYWNKDNNVLTVCDKNTAVQLPEGAKAQLGDDYLSSLDKFDLLVRTPALHPSEILKANPQVPDILNKLTTVTNEFMLVCPSRNIIGVTGTKGKGTTSTLIARMLEAAGKVVHLGGNIGVPPLDMLKNNIQPDDWVVLELANFQLIDIKHSPHIGVCLMVVPEHLDWHSDVDEYIHAKQQMFRWQENSDIAIYFEQNPNSKKIAAAGKGKKIPYFQLPGAEVKHGAVCIDDQVICATNEIKLLGEHNWENVCAAVTAVWQITQDIPAIRSVLMEFSGLEHRLEFVKEINGVRYYDDSFGTTPETAIVALRSFAEPKVIILGGSDKGSNYDDLALAVMDGNITAVLTIGETGSKIADHLRRLGYKNIIEGGSTMPEIVATAHSVAKPGDVVLLSTASASFGLFENYKDRGDQFKRAVQLLVLHHT